MNLDFPNFYSCRVCAEDHVIMFTKVKPVIDEEENKIILPIIHMRESFLKEYLGTDFTIEVREKVDDKIICTSFFDAGILSFGKLNLSEGDEFNILSIKEMEFEYAWCLDEDSLEAEEMPLLE